MRFQAMPSGLVAYPIARMVFGLAGIPKVVTILTLEHHRAVDVVLPAGFLSWAEDDFGRFAPMDAVFAFDECQALLGPPREPHPVCAALFQHRDVKAGAVLAAHDGIAFILHPPSRGLETLNI